MAIWAQATSSEKTFCGSKNKSCTCGNTLRRCPWRLCLGEPACHCKSSASCDNGSRPPASRTRSTMRCWTSSETGNFPGCIGGGACATVTSCVAGRRRYTSLPEKKTPLPSAAIGKPETPTCFSNVRTCCLLHSPPLEAIIANTALLARSMTSGSTSAAPSVFSPPPPPLPPAPAPSSSSSSCPATGAASAAAPRGMPSTPSAACLALPAATTAAAASPAAPA
mmetsp:Transcript_14227/g.39195  ORF Transcript_14227/g.39195 Transcript_14227/m.39195 type:complete len:223 (+) Transcript_14227:1917-2585(+)